MSKITALFVIFAVTVISHAADPRLEKDLVKKCVENSKQFLTSHDSYGLENEKEIICACRDVDPDCVAAVGETLHPVKAYTKPEFLSLVRGCRGPGMGKCFTSMSATMASFDRREVSQLLDMLKKCE